MQGQNLNQNIVQGQNLNQNIVQGQNLNQNILHGQNLNPDLNQNTIPVQSLARESISFGASQIRLLFGTGYYSR